jgi:hypothetical protein
LIAAIGYTRERTVAQQTMAPGLATARRDGLEIYNGAERRKQRTLRKAKS